MRLPKPPWSDKSGFGLAAVLMLVLLIVTLSMLAAGQISQFHYEVAHGLKSTQASGAADSGVARVLLELSRDPEYNPGTLVIPDGSLLSLPFLDKALGAEVDVINNFSGTSTVPTPDGPLAPGRVWLQSRGKVGDRFFRSQRSAAKAIVMRPDVIMDFGLRQLTGPIKLGNNNTVRSYLPAGVVDPKPPATFSDSVILRANEAGVQVPGSSSIFGKVEIPTADTPVSGSVTGGAVVREAAPPTLKFAEPLAFRALAHPDVSGAMLDLPSGQPYGAVIVSPGGKLVLHGGEYYFIDIDLGTNARIYVDGATLANPCIIYLGSGFRARGNNEINWGGSPRLLQIYDCDLEGDGINSNWIQAGSKLSCVWAGRETGLSFENNVIFYGAVDAKEVKFQNNCQLVFDESLVGQVLEGKPEWILTRKER